jgi:immune inhibitor A
VRKILLGAVLGGLLAILLAAPAGAVAPNEVLIAKHFQQMGLIPQYATPGMAQATVESIVGAGPDYEQKMPAVQRVLAGKKTALGRFLAPRATDPSATETFTTKCLVLLVEFGNDPWPAGSPTPTGPMTAGPAHGAIPAPAADDNATFWPGDFSPMHYQQEIFGNSYGLYDKTGALRGTSNDTPRNYYLEMSKGTFTLEGDIGNWVHLDLPESWYGADSEPWAVTDDLTGPVYRVAADAVQKFAAENPDFPWADYDNENPYGIMPGTFNQPDGIIDHLILIHAGSDQSAGGGAQDSDAIWAHSWGILANDGQGPGGFPGQMVPGTDGQGPDGTGIWAYNYTIDPEDCDPGVINHEFGHDLGLPDEYDYQSLSGDASSGFWTIMASGSWLGRQWGLGSQPAAMNVWDKSALGFISPKQVKRGTTATVTLQPAATGSATASGVKILLPKRKHTITLSGKDGATEWWSGTGNDLNNTLTTTAKWSVPSADPTLSTRIWYEIETDYDFGYVEVSTDGSTWASVESVGNTVAAPAGFGLTGIDTENWTTPISYDLSAYAGQDVFLRFRYRTDSGVAYRGWEVTDVALGGTPIPVTAFARDGWSRVDGLFTQMSENYYIAEYRTFGGSDASLKNCYVFNNNYTSWVDWFSYNRGLHLIYRDTFYQDNDVATHLGHGGWMVVDARPMPDGVAYADTVGYWRPRIQVRDASFSLKPTTTQSMYLKDYDANQPYGVDVGERLAPGKLAQPWFKDSRTYWYSETPEAGVKIPKNLGVRIQVRSMTADGMKIWVDNKK